MTLRQQFDDIIQMVEGIVVTRVEAEFIETVIGSTKIKDEMRYLEEKLYRLKKVVSKKGKQLSKLQKKVKKESSKLEAEKNKTKRAEEEKDALAVALEEIRSVVLGHKVTNAEILSLINSLSVSESSLDEK